RRVPRDAAESAEKDRLSLVPHHRVLGAPTADPRAASTGDADDLALAVDGSRCAGAVIAQRRQLPHLILAGSPQRRAELVNLRRDARRVLDFVLGPADHLALTVLVG